MPVLPSLWRGQLPFRLQWALLNGARQSRLEKEAECVSTETGVTHRIGIISMLHTFVRHFVCCGREWFLVLLAAVKKMRNSNSASTIITAQAQ